MAFERFIGTRIMDKENPMVTIGLTHFYYNAVASRLLELQSKRVIYHVDEEERKIAFEIIDDDHDHSYSVFPKKGGTGFRSASSDIVRRFDWIRAVASLKGAEKQKFRLRHKTNRFWFAELCPAFEMKVNRDNQSEIVSTASGIYRYLHQGEIVYIGKGQIRKRLGENGRDDWNFDTIEYSLISGEDRQYEWETYWINKFREANNNAFPMYNLVGGRGLK